MASSRRHLVFALKALFSLGVLAVVVERTGVDVILDAVLRVDLALLAAAFGLDVLNDLLSALRLRVLAGASGLGLSYPDAVRFHYFGKLFNAVLPTNIGGDVYKAYRVGDSMERSEAGYGAVVVDRLVGVVTWTAVAVAGTVAARSLLPPVYEVAVYGGALAVVAALAAAVALGRSSWALDPAARVDHPWLAEALVRVTDVVEALEGFRHRRRELAVAAGLSLLFDAVLILINAVIAVGLGMNVAPVYFFVYVPIAAFLLFVPVSVKGFGVREALYLVFFTAAGATAGQAVALAILVHLLELAAAAIGGGLYVLDSVRDRGPSRG